MRRVLLLVPLALLVTACGASAPSISGVAQAAEKTASAGSERMTIAGTMEAAGQTLQIAGSGVFDNDARRGKLGVDISARALNRRVHLDEVVDGFVVYMRLPPVLRSATKPWVKLDLAKTGRKLGVDYQALSQVNQADPTQMLRYLAASGDVTKVGEETVRGAHTAHYRATVDLEKVPDQAPADQRETVRKSIQRLIQLTGTKTYPVEVWIGDDQLVRRMKFDFSFAILGQHTSMSMAIDLFDFGAPVHVKLPPAGQVSELGGGA